MITIIYKIVSSIIILSLVSCLEAGNDKKDIAKLIRTSSGRTVEIVSSPNPKKRTETEQQKLTKQTKQNSTEQIIPTHEGDKNPANFLTKKQKQVIGNAIKEKLQL